MEISNQINEKFRRYNAPALMVLCLAIVLYAYQSTANDILTLWLKFDESMGHGLLVALTCIFLLYRGNAWRRSEAISSTFYGVIPLAITSMLWGIAHIVGINIIEQLLLPVLFLLAVLLVLGRNITRQILIPVMFIYFAIPVWDYLNNTLLQITVIVVQEFIRWSDIPAYIEGSSIFLPSGEILIASGCSGLRYFIVGCFLSILSAYLYHSSNVVRILIVLMCMGLALLANWIRVYSIIMIADISEMQSSLVEDHETLGWIVFMIFMTPLFYINYNYSGGEAEPEDDIKDKSTEVSKLRRLMAVFLLVPSIYVGPVIVKQADYRADYAIDEIIELPRSMEQWKSADKVERNFLWRPHFRLPDNYIFKSFVKDDVDASLFIFLYQKQEKYGDILPYISTIYDSATWSLAKTDKYVLGNTKGDIVLQKYYLTNKRTQEEMILVPHYNVGGLITPSYRIAKLFQIPAVLRKNAYAVLTVASINCEGDCTKADKYMNDYINFIIGQLKSIDMESQDSKP